MLRVSYIDCGFGRQWSVGPGYAAACACAARRSNCTRGTSGFFSMTVALLQGPRTLSRCLIEKVELESLAAARQNSSSRGPHAAEDREPRSKPLQSAISTISLHL